MELFLNMIFHKNTIILLINFINLKVHKKKRRRCHRSCTKKIIRMWKKFKKNLSKRYLPVLQGLNPEKD